MYEVRKIILLSWAKPVLVRILVRLYNNTLKYLLKASILQEVHDTLSTWYSQPRIYKMSMVKSS